MNLPTNWHTWGISAKAEYLVRVGTAKNYAVACSMLAKLRKKKPKPVAPRMPYAD